MKDNDITYQIRGAIYDVYKALGPGLLEFTKKPLFLNWNREVSK